MRTTVMTLAAAASLFGAALVGPALAGPITGSDTVGASVTSSNETGTNLGSASTFGIAGANQTFSLLSAGAGSFAAIPIDTTVPLACATVDLANKACFGFTSATVGTFTPTAITVFDQTATSLDVFLTGGFAPGSLFGPGATALLGASENLAFTQTNGGVISLSGTFASPPAPNPVPEPLPISLIGAGLAGILILRARRKAGII